MEMKKVRLVLTLKDCQTANYASNEDCILARAVKRILKKGYGISVSGFGEFKIWQGLPYSGKAIYHSNVPNFGAGIVMNAKKNFHLYVELPVECLRIPQKWVIDKVKIQAEIVRLVAKLASLCNLY